MPNDYQRRLFPSISMLAAFTAVADTRSFTKAAQALNLTQGAVSRQILALEHQLGIELLIRAHPMIRLTDAGELYAVAIKKALLDIRTASLNAITNSSGNHLNLAILPTFGTRWLMPRLPRFLSEHPHILINFSTKLSPFDFGADNLDAAIHFGEANWPNADHTFLMNEEVVPVCSPSFKAQHTTNSLEQLTKLPLLHLETRRTAWTNWFQANDLPAPAGHSMCFEQFSLVTQAAIAGMGIALLPEFLIRNELESGELCLIASKTVTSISKYYLVTPSARTNYPPVLAFRRWLLREIQADEGSPA